MKLLRIRQFLTFVILSVLQKNGEESRSTRPDWLKKEIPPIASGRAM